MTVRKRANCIFDVGMHRGEDTEYYLKKGFDVVAFEADPRLAQQCRERFAAELATGRLTIVEGAIVDPDAGDARPEAVTFFRNVGRSEWGTLDAGWVRRNERQGAASEAITVPAVHFADCLREFGVPHYLKIDIEGADVACLKALRDVAPRPDYVSLESDKVSFARLRGELDLLSELGYDRFQAVQQATVPRQRTPATSREGATIQHRFAPGASGLFGADLGGQWHPRSAMCWRYMLIFIAYRLFGDDGLLRRLRGGSRLVSWASRIMRRDVPGWYDTHARHGAVSNGRGDGS